MKNKLLYVLGLSLLLVGCNKGKDPVDSNLVHFETGYSDVIIEDSTTGIIQRPSLESGNGYTLFGYYFDSDFTQEVDFSKPITAKTIYVKGIKGSGSELDPFLISGEAQFKVLSLSGELDNKFYKLTNNFEITTTYSQVYESTVFDGVLDGNNHTITLSNELNTNGVSIGKSDTGLIHKIGPNGVVKNLNIVGAVEGAHASVGSLANFNEGKIMNVTTAGVSKHASNGYNSGVRLMTVWDSENTEIIKDFGRVGILEDLEKGGAGGIVGTNLGEISNCYNRMLVQCTIGGGGIAGINKGLIKDCYNKGAVGTTGNNSVNSSQIRDHEFDFSYIGGIAGANYGTITCSGNMNQIFVARLPWAFNNAPVGQNNFINRIRVGGIAGANFGTKEASEYTGGIITECFNYGRVHGDMQIGGIAGYSSGYISDCNVSSYIGGRYCVGGICGWQSGDKEGDEPSIVKNCFSLVRLTTGSASKTYLDENGNSIAGEQLTKLSSSNSQTNIVEYFKIAKYADNCIYHNYNGVENPIPLNGGSSMNLTVGSMSNSGYAKQLYDVYANGSDKWANPSDSSDSCTAIAAFDKNYDLFFQHLLKAQVKEVTYVINGTSTKLSLVAGVDYINQVVKPSANVYTSPVDSCIACAVYGRGLPENPITLSADQKLIWVLEEGNANSEWDGVVRDNITIYPMAVSK